MAHMEKGTSAGLSDAECSEIRMGDIVEMFGTTYEVVYESGAFGLVRLDGDCLDWERITEEVEYPDFCRNDNFVSLWELVWNFNCDEDQLYMLKRVGGAE